MRELLRGVCTELEVVGADAQVRVPAHPRLQPVVEPTGGLGGRHEELHLHLLELAHAEDEVAGSDLVAEGLADLGDPERRLLPGELQDVLEVDEDALGGLGAQVGHGALVLHRAQVRLEHQVELARLGEVAAALGALELALGLRLAQVVLAPAALALAEALDQRIGEPLQVARGLPDSGVHDHRGVDGDDVVPLVDHRPPPLVLHVLPEQDAVVAVVERRGQPPVDLGGLEDEAPPLAERDDLVHGHDVVGHASQSMAWSGARPINDRAALLPGLRCSPDQRSGCAPPRAPGPSRKGSK